MDASGAVGARSDTEYGATRATVRSNPSVPSMPATTLGTARPCVLPLGRRSNPSGDAAQSGSGDGVGAGVGASFLSATTPQTPAVPSVATPAVAVLLLDAVLPSNAARVIVAEAHARRRGDTKDGAVGTDDAGVAAGAPSDDDVITVAAAEAAAEAAAAAAVAVLLAGQGAPRRVEACRRHTRRR